MQLKSALAFLAATAHLAVAAPTRENPEDGGLRLIKTSPEDPGQWVSEEEKDNLVQASKRVGFVDITNVRNDEAFLAALSVNDESSEVESRIETRQVRYPTSLSHVAEANNLISRVSNTGPQSWLQTLTNYQNRHYRSSYGTQASTWLFNQVSSIVSANSAITVRRVTHSFNQPSVIARIPGRSSNLVIVGAHFDSTAGSTSARAPGADDNGSGTVSVMEALRVLAAASFQPQNTLEFHFYAGEEGGLLGSQDIFRSYRSSGANVLAFLNQDMTGYSPGGRAVVYQDYVNTSLTSYVTLIARQFTGNTVSTSRCGYGCSDHASANSAGFPSAFVSSEPFASSNPNIHTSRDALSTINWTSIQRHSRFTVGFLVEASYL